MVGLEVWKLLNFWIHEDFFSGKLTLIVNGAFGEPKTNKSEDIEATNKAYQFQVSTAHLP